MRNGGGREDANVWNMLGTVEMDVLLSFNFAAILYLSITGTFSAYSCPIIRQRPND